MHPAPKLHQVETEGIIDRIHGASGREEGKEDTNREANHQEALVTLGWHWLWRLEERDSKVDLIHEDGRVGVGGKEEPERIILWTR